MSTFKIAELTKSHRNSQIENNLFHWSHDFLFVFFDSTSNFYHFSDEEGHLNFKIGYLVFREMAGTVQWRFLARIWSQLSFIENALNNKKDFCAESSKSVSDLNRPPPPPTFGTAAQILILMEIVFGASLLLVDSQDTSTSRWTHGLWVASFKLLKLLQDL